MTELCVEYKTMFFRVGSISDHSISAIKYRGWQSYVQRRKQRFFFRVGLTPDHSISAMRIDTM